LANGYYGVPQALFLEGADQSLHYGDAAVMANGAESRPDTTALAPLLESLA
jgi:hypothetical protein